MVHTIYICCSIDENKEDNDCNDGEIMEMESEIDGSEHVYETTHWPNSDPCSGSSYNDKGTGSLSQNSNPLSESICTHSNRYYCCMLLLDDIHMMGSSQDSNAWASVSSQSSQVSTINVIVWLIPIYQVPWAPASTYMCEQMSS